MKHLPAFILVPSGPLLIGTPDGARSALARTYGGTRESYREESPQHTATLPKFAIARTPVTNALYAVFLADTGARPPASWGGAHPPAELAERPAVDLSWHRARELAAWATPHVRQDPANATILAALGHQAVVRLPAEAEWERAARGTDGRTFPWGETWQPDRAATRESGLAAPPAVDAYPAGISPVGCLGMAGGIWEWTASLDAEYPWRADGRDDPARPGRRILRGGSYANPHGYARCACRFRLLPEVTNPFLGVRLAIS